LGFANAVQQSKLLNAHYTERLLGTDLPAGSINGIHCFGHSGGSVGMTVTWRYVRFLATSLSCSRT
jgi:hypothetical protein